MSEDFPVTVSRFDPGLPSREVTIETSTGKIIVRGCRSQAQFEMLVARFRSDVDIRDAKHVHWADHPEDWPEEWSGV